MPRIVHLGDVCHVAVNIVRGLVYQNHSAFVLISSKVDAYAAADFIKINPLNKFGFLKHVYTLFFVIRYFNSIFHCHGMAAIFPYVLNISYVIHVHGSDLREIKNRKNVISCLYVQVLKKAAAVIVVTPDLIENYKELGLDVKKLYFIPNSVEITNLQPIRRKINYSRIRLFCPSSNHPIKCKNKLLTAFDMLYKKYGDRVSLTLINHPLTGRLIEEAQLEEGVKNNIFVLPFMKHEDLLKCYANYDIALDQFGDIKSHGVITYEACSAALPVISTIGENVFENSGIYPGNTPDLIFTSVSDLIDNQLIDEVGLKSYIWVSENLGISSITERIYSVYARCLANTKIGGTLS